LRQTRFASLILLAFVCATFAAAGAWSVASLFDLDAGSPICEHVCDEYVEALPVLAIQPAVGHPPCGTCIPYTAVLSPLLLTVSIHQPPEAT
jgi:hypothetical protein